MRLRTDLLLGVELVRVTMGLSLPQRGFKFFPVASYHAFILFFNVYIM